MARLPLPEKGFKMTSGAISGGIPSVFSNGVMAFITKFEIPLKVKSSANTKTVTRYGKMLKTVSSPLLAPTAKLS